MENKSIKTRLIENIVLFVLQMLVPILFFVDLFTIEQKKVSGYQTLVSFSSNIQVAIYSWIILFIAVGFMVSFIVSIKTKHELNTVKCCLALAQCFSIAMIFYTLTTNGFILGLSIILSFILVFVFTGIDVKVYHYHQRH